VRLAKKAARHYRKQRFAKAAELFKKAYDKHADPRLLFNLGKCQEKLGHFLEAARTYRRYLKAKPKAANRKSVEITIAYCKEKALLTHARLTIRSEPPGATVYLKADGESVGTTPVTRWAEAGKYELRVEIEGRLPYKKALDLSKGGEHEFDVKLVAKDAPGTIVLEEVGAGVEVLLDGKKVGVTPLAEPLQAKPGARNLTLTRPGHEPVRSLVRVPPGGEVAFAPTFVPLPPPPGGEEGSDGRALVPTAGWIGLGVAAAAGLGGVGSYAWASSAASDAKALSDQPGKQEEWRGLDEDTNRRTLMANIAFGVAGAAVVGATVFTVLHHMRDSAKPTAEPAAKPATEPAAEPGDEFDDDFDEEPDEADDETALLLYPVQGGAAAVWRVSF